MHVCTPAAAMRLRFSHPRRLHPSIHWTASCEVSSVLPSVAGSAWTITICALQPPLSMRAGLDEAVIWQAQFGTACSRAALLSVCGYYPVGPTIV